jgi:hypothetical protein
VPEDGESSLQGSSGYAAIPARCVRKVGEMGHDISDLKDEKSGGSGFAERRRTGLR